MSVAFLRAYRFSKLDTVIHALDPRLKLCISACFTILAITTFDPIEIGFLLVIQLAILYVGKSLALWARSLRSLVFFVILIMASQYLTTGDILRSTYFAVRFIVIASATSWFFFTTSPEDMGRTLEESGFPADVALSFTLSMRFIPVIADEFQSIFDAQRARGLQLDKGGFTSRLRAFLPILVPLFIEIIRRTYEIADALELRGYGAQPRRSHWKRSKLTRLDYVGALFFGACAGAVLYHRFFALT